MIELDGSEGGGQFLRSALSLSALTGESFRMADIRGGRSTPGLRHQHLAAVELLADLCDADVSDVAVGTESLTFRPGTVRPGTYSIDIGSAGSIALLFDAVLPIAVSTPGPIVVTARGGTDVRWSPTAAHYRRVKIRLLRRFGLQAVVELDRPGFYPAGGGEATLRLGPSRLAPLALSDRASVDLTDSTDRVGAVSARVFSLSSADLADRAVADRQAKAAVDGLTEVDLPVTERTVRYAEADSPGSSVLIQLDLGGALAGFDSLGKRGKTAEKVAAAAVADARAFLDETVAVVDRHTADQILVFLALVGGRIAVPEITDHIVTSRELLASFGLDVDIEGRSGTPVFSAGGRSELLGS